MPKLATGPAQQGVAAARRWIASLLTGSLPIPAGQPSFPQMVAGAILPDPQSMGAADALMPLGSVLGPGKGLVGGVKGLLTGERAVPAAAPAIKAYHGSPHDFDQFSVEKIGTGEGAQAYGHGLYFAENEGVAQSYKPFGDNQKVGTYADRASGAPFVPKNEEIRYIDEAKRYLANTGHAPGQALADVEKNISAGHPLRTQQNGEDVRDGLKLLSRLTEGTEKRGGRMYEVAIHADPESFLDWDKPLSQQSAKVQKAAQDLFIDAQNGYYGRYSQRNLGRDPTGDSIYAEVRAMREAGKGRAGPQGASEALQQQGIPGLRYLDQGSRTAGEGTHNYTIWDDSIIRVLRKYGIIPPLLTGAAATERPSQPRQLLTGR